MGTTYKVRLEDMADAYESLDEDEAAELRELISDDDEWLDLDKSGREIAELAEAIGLEDPFDGDLDSARVKKLAKALEPLKWAKAAEHLPNAEALYVKPYYEAFRDLVRIAAKLGQAIEMEVG